MYSVIIKSGTIIDGTGSAPYKADIAIQNDQIVNIAPNINTDAKLVINASDLVVTPGFIDIQNHSDSYWSLFDNPELDSLISQGITSILIGQCGASLAPLVSSQSLLSIQKWHSLDGININWMSFAEFLTALSERKFGTNVGSLVGYSTIRRALVGDEVRNLTKEELNSFKQILKTSLDNGAFGLSSGLAYSHEANISQDELSALATLVTQNNGLFSLHLRNEGDKIQESIEEVVNLSKSTNARIKISHLKVRGKNNVSLTSKVLETLEIAYHQGLDIHFDVYPYASTWQPVHSYLPNWAMLGGRAAFKERIQNEADRRRILIELGENGSKIADLIIASTTNLGGIVGKTIGSMATNANISSEEMLLEIIAKGGSETMVFDNCVDEVVIDKLLNHALSMIATDGGGFSLNTDGLTKGINNRLIHQRSFGTTANFLARFKEKKDKLPEAIAKLTATPARVAGFVGRGEIKIGNFADISVFNPDEITDNSTLLNPYRKVSGFSYVLVNGQLALDQGQLTGQKTGKVLRKKQ